MISRDISPSDRAIAVTPSDTVQISIPRSLYVGTAGNLAVRFLGDSADTVFKNVPAGTTLGICPTYVRAATTAADIVALY